VLRLPRSICALVCASPFVLAAPAIAQVVPIQPLTQEELESQDTPEASGRDCRIYSLSLAGSLSQNENLGFNKRPGPDGDDPNRGRIFGKLTIDFPDPSAIPVVAGPYGDASAKYVAAKAAGDTNGQEAARAAMDFEIEVLTRRLVDAREASESEASVTEARLQAAIADYERVTRASPRAWQPTGFCEGTFEPFQPSVELPDFAMEILGFHNAARAAVRAPPLAWDFVKAGFAGDWAIHMADTGEFEHSPREGRGADRENIAMGPLGSTWDVPLGLWLGEEEDFMPGIFPDVSLSWNVDGVLHYTQMIWFGTVAIGCGKAEGHGSAWFVCRYSPGGNRDGEWVGLVPITVVPFDQDSVQLSDAAYTALDEAITNYKAIGYASVDFHGASPGVASGRTEVIEDYLTSHGVPPDALASGKVIITNLDPPPPPPLPPSVEPSPFIVYFDWDKDEITPQTAAILDNAAAAYQQTGKATIVLAGHADRSGNASYDAGLAQRRANNVRSYLAGRGVPDSIITTSAFGEAPGEAAGGQRSVQISFGPGSGW